MTIILDDKRQAFRVSILAVYKYRQINSAEMEQLRQWLVSFDDSTRKHCNKLLFAAEEYRDFVNLSLGGVVFHANEKLAVGTTYLMELQLEDYSVKIHAVCSVLDCELDKHKSGAYKIRAKFEFFAKQDDKILNKVLERELVEITK